MVKLLALVATLVVGGQGEPVSHYDFSCSNGEPWLVEIMWIPTSMKWFLEPPIDGWDPALRSRELVREIEPVLANTAGNGYRRTVPILHTSRKHVLAAYDGDWDRMSNYSGFVWGFARDHGQVLWSAVHPDGRRQSTRGDG